MTGETKPGDAVADKARDVFSRNQRERERTIERLRVRAEMRSEHEDEDTGVAHLRADQRLALRDAEAAAKESGPPGKQPAWTVVVTVVRKFPPWGSVIVALAAIAAYVLLRLRGALP